VRHNNPVAKTATEAIRILWAEAFFRGWKKKAGIEEKLAKRGNHFSNAELGMALKRATYLTRRGNRGSYEYIQKHPFVADGLPQQGVKKSSNHRRIENHEPGA
jgi:hypothetical protein